MCHAAPDHPGHSGNLPENPGQPQRIARKALGLCSPRVAPGMHTYFIYVLAFPSGKTYGCFFRKTWPTLLQGTISRLPPHIHTLKDISARQPCLPSRLCLEGVGGHRMAAWRHQKMPGPRRRSGPAAPRRGCEANSYALHGLGNLIPHPQVGMLITHTWEGGVC